MVQRESNETNDIWTRYLSGEQLSVVDADRLQETLANDYAMRKQLLQDDAMHRMLMAVAPSDDDPRQFLQGVLSRCTELSQPEGSSDVPQPPPIVSTTAPQETDLPLVSVAPAMAQRTVRREQAKRSSKSAFRTIQIAAAIAAIFGAGVIAGRIGSRPATKLVSPSPQKRQAKIGAQPTIVPKQAIGTQRIGEQKMQVLPAAEFATLTSSSFGAWKRPRVDGSRLTAGEIVLQRGEGEIAFDNGATLQLIAPVTVQLVSTDLVNVSHGKISAMVPESAYGLRVVTPTSQVIDQGSEFELVVNPQGATDVLVHRGNVIVQPWPGGNHTREPLALASSKLNRATVFEPIVDAEVDGDVDGPLATLARNGDGSFLGQISVNGESIEFSSPESFENVRHRAGDRFRESADRFQQDWADVMKTFNAGAAGGSLSVNGLNVGFDSVDDIVNLQQNMLQKAKQRGKSAVPGEASFQGTLNINGEVRTFTSPEEFDKAQRAMFGPLKTLGIDVFDMANFQEMFNNPQTEGEGGEPTNPFVPRDDK
ncbi:MAG: hypothetical protein AB8B91_09100 [Rubripirellula sp.]